MRQRGRVSSVLQLTEHLVVREDLPGVVAAELEEATQERRLGDALHEQDVAGDGGLDEGVTDVGAPTLLVRHERRRARITTEVDVAVEVPAKGVAHLREGPLGRANELEAPRETLGEPRLHQQR